MIEIFLLVFMGILTSCSVVLLSRYLAKTMIRQVDERFELKLRTTLFELEQQLTKIEAYLIFKTKNATEVNKRD